MGAVAAVRGIGDYGFMLVQDSNVILRSAIDKEHKV